MTLLAFVMRLLCLCLVACLCYAFVMSMLACVVLSPHGFSGRLLEFQPVFVHRSRLRLNPSFIESPFDVAALRNMQCRAPPKPNITDFDTQKLETESRQKIDSK